MIKQNEKIIAIFDDDLKVIGHLDHNLDLELTKYVSKDSENKLQQSMQYLEGHLPRIISENITAERLTLDLVSVPKDDDNFLSALEEELKLQGFKVKLMPKVLKPLLLWTSEKLTLEQREGVMGDLVNSPDDLDENAVNELQSILEELLTVEHTQDEWKDLQKFI